MINWISYARTALGAANDDERGEWPGNGLLITILIVLAIIAVFAWIIFNVDINEK